MENVENVKIVKVVYMASVSLEDGQSLEGSNHKKKRKREEEVQDEPEKFRKFEESDNNVASSNLKKIQISNSAMANNMGGGMQKKEIRIFGIEPSSWGFKLKKTFDIFGHLCPGH